MSTKTLTWLLIVGGFALQAISYFFFGAPIGKPTGVQFSQPRVPFVGAFFILGVGMVFTAALVYEIRGGREDRGD